VKCPVTWNTIQWVTLSFAKTLVLKSRTGFKPKLNHNIMMQCVVSTWYYASQQENGIRSMLTHPTLISNRYPDAFHPLTYRHILLMPLVLRWLRVCG